MLACAHAHAHDHSAGIHARTYTQTHALAGTGTQTGARNPTAERTLIDTRRRVGKADVVDELSLRECRAGRPQGRLGMEERPCCRANGSNLSCGPHAACTARTGRRGLDHRVEAAPHGVDEHNVLSPLRRPELRAPVAR